MIEILSDAIVASRLPPPPSGSDALLCFGGFCIGASFAVVASDGQICTLHPGRPRGGPGLRYWPAARVSVAESGPLAVPPSFWAGASLDRGGSVVVDARGQAVQPRKVVFDSSPARLWVRLDSSGHAIVGVALGFGPHTRLTSVKVRDRRHAVTSLSQKRLFFALAPAEVEAGADVPIEVDYSGAIEITDLDVYTIPWEAKPAPDWRSAAGDLRAFTDAPEPQLENDVEFIAASLSAAPFVARGPEDEEAAVGLIALMYERPKLAHFCRRIVLKAFGDAEALERLWARAIVDVCEHGCIAGEMRPLFWRDFALLPLAERDRIGAVVWGSMGDGPGIYAVIAGLGE